MTQYNETGPLATMNHAALMPFYMLLSVFVNKGMFHLKGINASYIPFNMPLPIFSKKGREHVKWYVASIYAFSDENCLFT